MTSTKKPFISILRNAIFISLHTHAKSFSAGNMKCPKIILFLVSFCFILSHVIAEPVDPQSALKAAQEFVHKSPSVKNAPKRGATTQQDKIVYTHKMPQSDRAAFYIVNVNDAFVLVSADDVAYQVLGYSFDKSFPIASDGTVHLPPQIKGFFDDLARQIESAADAESNRSLSNNGTRKALPRRSPSNLPENVDPLLTTTWDQVQYYNILCPEDAEGLDGHVVTGCIATAMAQIINYWSYPSQGRGIHSYDSDYGTLEVNFENSIYDFNNMPDLLTAESTEEQVNAVAKLMYDCGVAVNMQYTTFDSEAFDFEARAALINYFRFSPDLSFVEKACFTNEDWNNLIRENIAANQPVYYSGQGTGGHAFVCDGYKADDYFHFNFGWGGFADGWFLTSAIEPSGDNFSSNQFAIVGILPDNNGHVIISQMTGNSTFTVDEPFEFYHMMGHNAYEGISYGNECHNTVSFIPNDEGKQLVVDVIEFEDQSVSIYDGPNSNNWIRDLSGGSDNDLSPVVSTQNGITFNYSGNLSYMGFKFCVSQESDYRMVSNIVSTIDVTTVHLTWTENGSATQWQIEYGLKGFELGEGTVYNTNTNSATIENLEKFTEYDFYIRSVYDSNQYGPWNKVSMEIEAPYWQDIVTTQPEGYFYNEEKNRVEISTAEGLAWWAKNGCNEDVILTADINMSGYKWKPVSSSHDFWGQGHVISNVYIKEYNGDIGLFSRFSGLFDNVGLEGFNVNGFNDGGDVTGGLCGTLWGLDESIGTIKNCYMKHSSINGHDFTGGLIGGNAHGTVINCFVNADVVGWRWTGLLIGSSTGIERNCYAAGNFQQHAYCYNGGIFAYSGEGEVSYCYSIETPMGVLGYTGSTIVNDTSTIICSDTEWVLMTPVDFDGTTELNLLTALNKYLLQINDGTLLMWTADVDNTNDGFPVLGMQHFVVQCPNVSNMYVQNKKTGDTPSVVVSWQENGSASQWTIRYRRNDIKDSPYTYITTTQNPYTIEGIPLGFVYDFSVRAELSTEQVSGWCETQHVIVDLPYWTDVVTEQPEGYVEDAEGNVTITTTEGLAWLAVRVNGLHGHEWDDYGGRTVTLTADIDLAGYRWNPIGNSFWFSGNFDGQGHSISNIYVNDAFSHKGLFGRVRSESIMNVNLIGGFVGSIFSQAEGEDRAFPSSAIGGLVGDAGCNITNCHSSVNVYGNRSVGSLCGYAGGIISNCSATGMVTGVQACGGLVGEAYEGEIRNSYASGNINVISGDIHASTAKCIGGLVGEFSFSYVNNCYSTGTINADRNNISWIGNVIGCPYIDPHIHYLYGQEDINEGLDLLGNPCEDLSNATLFQHNGTTNTLVNPISIGETNYTDLVEALNAWVDANNTEGQYRHWVADTENKNGGYPIFAPNLGDVNGDGSLSVTDVGMMISYILQTNPEGFNKDAADMNGDGDITVTDVGALITKILTGK